jgi:hypothetical protein
MVRLIKLFTTIIILSTGILTGCASVKIANQSEDAKAKTFATNPQQATLYIYRNEFMGAAIRMSVELNGREIGKTGSKTYFAVGVAPGKHTLTSKAENDSSLEIMTEAGRNYYIWQEVKMGLLSARSKLQLVAEAQGQAGVRESSLLENNTDVSKAAFTLSPTEKPAQPAEQIAIATPNVVAKPVLAPVSKPAPNVAATQTVADTNVPAPESMTTKIERVPFELGVSSVTVERMAKQNSCQSAKGAGLLHKKGPVEVYRVMCEDGREIKARCEMRQCEIFNP